MLRLITKYWSKWSYIFRKLNEAETHEWNAKVAERNAKVTRELIAQLTKEADTMDARIKEVAEMEEKGYWECENGHEVQLIKNKPPEPTDSCPECWKPLKLVKRSEMSGQEKYDSDKERKDVEKMVAAKRADIAEKQEMLKAQEQTVNYFRGQAASSRGLAENLRKV